MKKYLQRLKNERGLTLVELLAVVVILAIVATIAFVMIANVIENSKKDAHIANATQLIASAKLYEVAESDEIGSGGVTSGDLMGKGEDGETYLDKFINPWDAKDNTYIGTVIKEDGKYMVTIAGETDKCEIGEENGDEETLAKGRDEVCD